MYPDYPYTPVDDGIAMIGGILIVVLLIYLLMFAFMILTYVLQSRGMQVIAKRRGIRHAWLAWIPVGNMWILGCISDQYRYVAKGQIRNRRKALMGLTIAMYALMMVIYIPYFGIIFEAIASGGDASSSMMMSYAAMMLVFALALLVVAIIAAVFQYMALYDLFVSCEPNNAVMYLVLSIFINVTLPFFVFACRKKDCGMPPRKPVTPAEPVLQQPVQEAPAEPGLEEAVAEPAEDAVEEYTEETAEE